MSSSDSTSHASPHHHKFVGTAGYGPDVDCGGNCARHIGWRDYETDPTTIGISTTTETSTTTTCSLSSHDSNIGGVATGANTGGETRPSNMKVIYIIRVY